MAGAPGAVVLDAGPVVSLLIDDAAAVEVSASLAHAERLRISLVNVAEVLDVLQRVYGVSPGGAHEAVGRFLDEAADPVAVNRATAVLAADLRARHYDRNVCDVSMADCFAVATTRSDDVIATSDRGVARVARAEGLTVLALPNAAGRRP